MTNLTDIGKQIKATTEALAKADAELKWELAASAADVAGLVDPTPASDLIGAGLALRKGDWLGAGMSVVSMVPYAGDALAKPAKAVRATKRINELRQTITKLTGKLADLRKAEQQAKAAEAAAKKAKIADGAGGTNAAKQAAGGQQGTAKGGKDKDCEDCGGGGGAKGKSNKPARLPETKVPCFHPFDKKKFTGLSEGEKKSYLQEMQKQLSRQQNAINNVTASEFKAARDAFKANSRNPAAATMQERYRDDVESTIRDSIYESMLGKGMSPREAQRRAMERATEVMSKLAALHEPDMVAGGYLHPEPSSMGRADVNSSIGSSWNQRGRIAAMDRAANEAIKAGNGGHHMNVKLEPCRGKGLR